nr:hypothetical protein [Tanacetum cinerariifolium]
MLTARKRVRALPVCRLASRYPPNHSSTDHFSSYDPSLDSSSDSSLDYSSDSSSGHSLPDSSFDAPTTIFAEPSRKRYRSLAASVPLATPVPGTLSPMRADMLPPCKRIRGSVTASDYDDRTEESYEAYTKPDIDFDVQEDIDADTTVEEEAESEVRSTIKIRVNGVLDIESAQREQRCRMLAASEQRSGMLDRIRVLERDNIRLRGMLSVKRETMPTTTRTKITPAAIKKTIERHVAEALEAYEANRNRRPTMESGDGHEDDNGGNHGKRNGNENGLNGDGNPNLNTRGVVGLTRWFEKTETEFYISDCPQKYQVKDATCTLQNRVLTWWNSHKRTNAAYAMTWKELMKLMIEVYCPRNEIQKIETEL